MELDNLKKIWQQTEVKSSINEEKIQRMVDNKGQSAFNSLLKYEKMFLLLLIPCILFDVILYQISPFAGIVYMAAIPIGAIWQLYKIKCLKSIDFVQMNILEVSKRINKYKLFIKSEIIVGCLCSIVFFTAYFIDFYHFFSQIPATVRFASMGIGVVTTIISLFFIYKYLYIKNIKKIETSVKEIEEFESEE